MLIMTIHRGVMLYHMCVPEARSVLLKLDISGF